jgi:transposase
MTLQPRDWTIIPEQTAQITRAAFPKGNIYMKMRDELGVLYADSDFVTLFRADCGQPAISPGQLALVTVMQFAEGLSDRQTADAVRARLDWKYALGLELTDPGFDFSVLSEFRSRLIKSGRENQLLEQMLRSFVQKGLIQARGKARTDSTHVLALAEQNLLPGEHLVDTAYVDAQHLLTSRVKYDLELVGPVPGDTSWQAQTGQGFDLSCFQVDWEAKRVTCPVGCQSRSWRLHSDNYDNLSHSLKIISHPRL